MRIDVYLNAVCILKSRTLAKEACERGKITVNGEPAKAARAVAAGDRIRLDLGTRVLEVRVLEVPPGRVSRSSARDHYQVLSDQRPEPEF